MLPEFNQEGNLPVGIHQATEAEVLSRFASGLARKTMCFSKSVFMHDTVIGLFVNRYEFGTPI